MTSRSPLRLALLSATSLALVLAACGSKADHDHPHGDHDHPHGDHDHPHGDHDHPHGDHDHPHGDHDHPHGDHDHTAGAAEHGERVDLGATKVGGYRFSVARRGAVVAGHEAAVELTATAAPEGRDWKTASVYVWVEDAGGQKLSAPEKAHVEGGVLHAHAVIPKGKPGEPTQLAVRVREGDVDETVRVALHGGEQGHDH